MLDTSRSRYDHADDFMAGWRRQQSYINGGGYEQPLFTRTRSKPSRAVFNQVRSILNDARNAAGRASR